MSNVFFEGSNLRTIKSLEKYVSRSQFSIKALDSNNLKLSKVWGSGQAGSERLKSESIAPNLSKDFLSMS